VLLIWYVVARQGGGQTVVSLYDSPLRDKLLSLEPLTFFLRPDPFQSPVSTPAANLLCTLALGAAVLVNVRRPLFGRLAPPVAAAAAILWIFFLCLPFSE